MSVQHVVDWRNGESYFAIVHGRGILKRLNARNWSDAARQFAAYRGQRS